MLIGLNRRIVWLRFCDHGDEPSVSMKNVNPFMTEWASSAEGRCTVERMNDLASYLSA